MSASDCNKRIIITRGKQEDIEKENPWTFTNTVYDTTNKCIIQKVGNKLERIEHHTTNTLELLPYELVVSVNNPRCILIGGKPNKVFLLKEDVFIV